MREIQLKIKLKSQNPGKFKEFMFQFIVVFSIKVIDYFLCQKDLLQDFF